MVVSQVPKKRIASLFGRNARFYDSDAEVQNSILRKLAQRLRAEIEQGETWCDIGGGTGKLLEYAAPLPENSKVICLDLALGSLRIAAGPHRKAAAVNGDAQFLPFGDSVLDGIIMSSMLQWVSEPL
ncbi:MAG: class I SAM-dependent methyltransferase, partial [Chitinispirillaceae bacterium]